MVLTLVGDSTMTSDLVTMLYLTILNGYGQRLSAHRTASWPGNLRLSGRRQIKVKMVELPRRLIEADAGPDFFEFSASHCYQDQREHGGSAHVTCRSAEPILYFDRSRAPSAPVNSRRPEPGRGALAAPPSVAGSSAVRKPAVPAPIRSGARAAATVRR